MGEGAANSSRALQGRERQAVPGVWGREQLKQGLRGAYRLMQKCPLSSVALQYTA